MKNFNKIIFRALICLALVGLGNSAAIAQPANDDCINVIDLGTPSGVCDGITVSGTVDNTAGTASANALTTCDGAGTNLDFYYSFTAPAGGTVEVLVNSGTDLEFTLWEGACPDAGGIEVTAVCVGNTDAGQTGLAGGLTPGTLYILHGWTDDFNANVIEFCIGEPAPPAPGNECTTAIPYPGDVAAGTCVTGFDFSTFDETGLSPEPTCDFGGDAVAWFTWTAPVITAAGDPIDLEFDDGDGFPNNCAIGIEAYAADCSAPVSNCLGNASGILTGLTQGTDYLLLIYDDSPLPAANNCDFCLSLACSSPQITASAVCMIGDEANFMIEVDVTNIGIGNTAYTVDVGGAQANITAAGTYSYGPFPSGTPVDVVLTGVDDTACGATIAGLDATCTCDPTAVEASDDVTACEGDPVDLSATLNVVIPGSFVGYNVTTAAAGSCTAAPAGTPNVLTLGDDAGSGPLPIGFNFDFFGNTYTDVCVGSNGYVTFTCVDETDLSEDPIPSTNDPNGIIALFWEDLDPGDGGTVSTYSSSVGGANCFVVDFDQVIHCCTAPNETVTGQIIICDDNTITINCIDCQSDNGADSAVQGIENEAGDDGYFDPAFTDGVVPGAASTSNCVTFTPDVLDPSACAFVGWATDLNDVAGSTVSTDNPASITAPAATTTYYAVSDCAGVPCFDEVVVTIDDPANCAPPECTVCADCETPNEIPFSGEFPFDGGGGAFDDGTQMFIPATAENTFAGHGWFIDVAALDPGLGNSDYCIFADFNVIADPADFPFTLEFRIENNGVGPQINFNTVITAAGPITLGGNLAAGTMSGAFDINGTAPALIVAIADFDGDTETADITVEYSNFYITDGTCNPAVLADPAAPVVTDQACDTDGITLIPGNIDYTASTCDAGSTLEYSTDGGATWGTAAITYDDVVAAGGSVDVRCACANGAASNAVNTTTDPQECNAPVFTLGLTDPCNCASGFDLDGDGVNEFAQETITITPGVAPYTVTNLVGNVYDNTGAPLTAADLTALISGTTLSFFVDADGASTYTVEITDGAGSVDSVDGGPCDVCPETVAIPTLSEWGLITLALMLMSFGAIAISSSKLAFAGTQNIPVPFTNNFNLPINKAIFRKAMMFTGVLTLVGFMICFAIYGAIFLPDIIGVAIAGPVFAYLMHLLYLSEKS